MILWRVLPWRSTARVDEPGGALWFPRTFQGAGRHDNPDRYGCLYLAERPASAVAETLAPFRGAGPVRPAMLRRSGSPLALARLEVDDGVEAVDLDDPAVLMHERLRPSRVATRHRERTRRDAARLFTSHPAATALRWWSTLEASWMNWTVFDRAARHLTAHDVEPLGPEHPAVAEAAELLGLA